MIKSLRNFLVFGSQRSLRAKKNILFLFAIKGGAILCSFLLVPLTLNYIGQSEYGIWITLSSIVGWISFFDIGLGNGLRNKFAELKALKKDSLLRSYVSTSYALLTSIAIVLLLLFILIFPYINWYQILNTDEKLKHEINSLVLIVVIFFLFNFVLKLINTILTADQRPAQSNLLELIGSVIGLFTIFVLTKTTTGSLLVVGIIYSGKSIIVLFIASVVYFRNKYKFIRPSVKHINLKLTKYLSNLGIKFFIIQISYLIIFQTSNFIVIRLFDPASVTIYAIANRYFSVSSMIFFIVLNPFWSAFTDAYTLKDYTWIKNIMKKLLKFWVLVVLGLGIMVLLSQRFFKIWVGEDIHIPMDLCVFFAINYAIYTWCGIYSQFLNGTGRVKLQLMFAILDAIIYIPLAILYVRGFKLGLTGVILALISVNLINAVWSPIQYKKIIHKKAYGIWNQ